MITGSESHLSGVSSAKCVLSDRLLGQSANLDHHTIDKPEHKTSEAPHSS